MATTTQQREQDAKGAPGERALTSRSLPAWRTAGGDNSRRGLGTAQGQFNTKPTAKLRAHGAIHASPVFDQAGQCFVADMAGWVQAFTPGGRMSWEAQLDSGLSATPTVHASRPWLFAGTHKGTVYAIDTDKGSIQWRKAIRSQSDPRILSDLLHLAGADLVVLSGWGGKFVALDAETGEDRFAWDAGAYPSSAAAADADGSIYCIRAVGGKGVECLRVKEAGNEHVLHREPEDQRGARRALVTAGPVLDEERDLVCFVLNQNKSAQLLGFSMKSGSLRWRRALPSTVHAVPTILGNGVIMVPDLAGAIHGIKPDGEPAFHHETGCEYLLAAAVGRPDGTSFLGDPWGRLHQIDGQGAGRAVFEASRSIQGRPSFDSAGKLYVPCTDRSVYLFG